MVEGGPYKATVKSVSTYISHSRYVALYEGSRHTRYDVLLEDGRRTDAYNVAIFHTKAEAQQRLEGLNKLGLYTKEYSKAVLDELRKNPDVVLINEEQDNKDFVSLVKKMRTAQEAFQNAISSEDIDQMDMCQIRMLDLERDVDEYLKKMEEQ